MTQTIPYREGKHFGTLSIDINDPEDALFLEQFKRIPSKNRDYIAALYAREKRRGVNRHVGDHIQPLSLTKQVDSIDMQKTNLNIDKNALQESIKRIEKRTEEIKQELEYEQDSNKRAALENERKMLDVEREKIKARADELGIKIAALSAKSSTGGSSPLKPDQLITIIKKLQEQGNASDLSAVLNKIENLRLDSSSMTPFISVLTDLLDKTFVYRNGQSLGLSIIPIGLNTLNKIRTDRRIEGRVESKRNEVDNALETVISLYKNPSGNISVKAGLGMDYSVAEALFRTLVSTLLMAIDFEFKDTDFDKMIYNEYYNRRTVIKYLKEIRSIVDNSTHIHSGFEPVKELDSTKIESIEKTAKEIYDAFDKAAKIASNNIVPNETNLSARNNICAILLGITSSKINGFNALSDKRNKLIQAYNTNNTEEAADVFTQNEQKTYSKTLMRRAFDAIDRTTESLQNDLNKINGIKYNRSNNSLTIGTKTMYNVFSYVIKRRAHIIDTNITPDGMTEFLKRVEYDNPATSNMITDSSISFERHDPDGYKDADFQTGENIIDTHEEEEEEEEAKPDEEEARAEEEEVKSRPRKRTKKADNMSEGIVAGYIKIIDKGNPLKRRYR